MFNNVNTPLHTKPHLSTIINNVDTLKEGKEKLKEPRKKKREEFLF
jgi:hypothetical protein